MIMKSQLFCVKIFIDLRYKSIKKQGVAISGTIYTIQDLAKYCGMPYAMFNDSIRDLGQELRFFRYLQR